MLMVYKMLTFFTSILFYIASHWFFSGHLAGYDASVKGLLENYKADISTTTFSMLMNSTVTLVSLTLTLIFGSIVMGFSFNGFLKPDKKSAVRGLSLFPACFLLNIIFSILVNYFTSMMNTVGVKIPEADFTIKSPSTAAVIFEFLYLSIVAPLVEEIIYRGMILGSLSKYGEIPAVVMSALCFGLMHGNIPQATSAFATGLAYASIAMTCHSILPTLLIHSLNNFAVSMVTMGKALGIPHIVEAAGILEVVLGILGFYILMTRYSFFKHETRGAKATLKAIVTNPVMLLYLAILVWSIISSIINAN